ncbi:MAG: glycosyltransferase family 4 protein [Pseudomonadota bacterium]
MPRHIVALARALSPIADITVISETDRGGYTGFDGRHIVLRGLSSSLRPDSIWRGYQALLDALHAEEADLVWFHARLPVILGRLGAARGALKGRVTVTFHGLPFGPGHRRAMAVISGGLERWLARRSRPLNMVFLSDEQRNVMTAHLGDDAKRHRMWVLGNASTLGPIPSSAGRPRGRPTGLSTGLSTELSTELSTGRHLVMTGRAGWQKNLEAAAAILPHLQESTELSLCGPGTDAPRFADKLRTLAGTARSRLHILGPVSDVAALLATADGYLLTSRYEGEPIGALEAWEAGLPVFLADFPGAQDLAKHPFSHVFGSADPAARAQEIEKGLEIYIANRIENQGSIRTSWAKHHAPDAFAANARNLLETFLATEP